MTGPVATTVLGSGVAATACALFAARHGPVQLSGRPPARPTPAVESVPAAALTLLLELGVVPRELDVPGLLRRGTVAWETAAPVDRDGPPVAHLDRAALLDALWRRAAADPRITLLPRLADPSLAPGRVIDATGVRARTAGGRTRPPRTWVAATSTLRRAGADPGLRLAAARRGYAYRLGSGRLVTVGWVTPERPPREAPALWRTIDREAPWLLEGLPDPPREPTSRRPASLTLPAVGASAIPVGDAAFARDALASQGISIALSDACFAADPRSAPALTARHAEARERHVRHLVAALRDCRYAREPAWAAYLRWLTHDSGISA